MSQPHHFLFCFSPFLPTFQPGPAASPTTTQHFEIPSPHPLSQKKNKTKHSEQPKKTTYIASDTVSKYGRVFWRRRPDDLLGKASAAGKKFSTSIFFCVCVCVYVFFFVQGSRNMLKKRKEKRWKEEKHIKPNVPTTGNYFAVFSEEEKEKEKKKNTEGKKKANGICYVLTCVPTHETFIFVQLQMPIFIHRHHCHPTPF